MMSVVEARSATGVKMRRLVGDRTGIGGVCGRDTGKGEVGPDEAKRGS